MSEKVLDEENWKNEAQAVINDIRNHVKDAVTSNKLQSSNRSIYINLTTLEDGKYCVELSGLGFRIVGARYDDADIKDGRCFETPYSLLNQISPDFRKSFENELIDKLSALNGDDN